MVELHALFLFIGIGIAHVEIQSPPEAVVNMILKHLLIVGRGRRWRCGASGKSAASHCYVTSAVCKASGRRHSKGTAHHLHCLS